MELDRFRELIRRRGTGEPVAYLLGERAFRRLVLRSDGRALVPRPETEALVEVALAALPEGGSLLDVGTGRATSRSRVADERPDVDVVAVDVSADALALAAANVDALAPGRVELLRSDLYAAVPPRADASTSSPATCPTSPTATRRWTPARGEHEPRGRAVRRRRRARHHAPRGRRSAADLAQAGGTMAMEFGGAQEDLIGDVMLGAGLIDVRTARDLAGIERVVYARLPGDAMTRTLTLDDDLGPLVRGVPRRPPDDRPDGHRLRMATGAHQADGCARLSR